jgi:hypothetical protein
MAKSNQEVIDELRELRDRELEERSNDMDPSFQKEHMIRAECYQKALWLMGAI